MKLPIGKSDFKSVIEDNRYYVDKTPFIREIIDASADVVLLPRPRRFGKTLNLSMLRYFFEISQETRASLFKGLAISDDALFETRQGKHPVICLTFKDVKDRNWTACLKNIQAAIYDEFTRFRYLAESDVLYPDEKSYFERIINGKASETDANRALKNLSTFLRRFHGERVVILIDEYDTPVYAGYANGYYEEIISFMRNLLSGGLKDNEHLFKGVLTGILRVAKESIFSGLNNLGVFTLLEPQFSEVFGFTEPEVKRMLKDYGMEASCEMASF